MVAPILFPHAFYLLVETTLNGLPSGREARFKDTGEGRRALKALLCKKRISAAHADFVIAITQQNPNVPYDLVESDETALGEVIIWSGQLTLKRFARS